MKYPSISQLDTMAAVEHDPMLVFEMVNSCIEYIYDGEELFHAHDQTEAELTQFIEGLTKDQFKKIEVFFTSMPKFRHSIQYTCAVCEHKHDYTIEGFSNFF